MSRRLRLLVAGAVVALAASLGGGVTAAPAHAALCSPGAGVSVVVDHGVLGGGVATVCDAGGGGDTAAVLFPDNGFALTYVQRMPGFVCRVNGLPTPEATPCHNTPPPDAYWALFHSDGTSGTWVYAASGVAGLKVSDGESVALVWQNSSTRRAPGVTPPKSAPQPEPTATTSTRPSPTTSARPSTQPSPTASDSAAPTGSPSATTSASPIDGATEKKRKRRADRADRSGSPTPDPTNDSDDVASPPVDPAQPAGGGGVPLWIVGGLTVLAVLGAGAATYLRRAH